MHCLSEQDPPPPCGWTRERHSASALHVLKYLSSRLDLPPADASPRAVQVHSLVLGLDAKVDAGLQGVLKVDAGLQGVHEKLDTLPLRMKQMCAARAVAWHMCSCFLLWVHTQTEERERGRAL